MNGKERIALTIQGVADGTTSVEHATERVTMIFGDIYDEGRYLVVQSLNPPTVVKPDRNTEGNVIYYDFGGEG